MDHTEREKGEGATMASALEGVGKREPQNIVDLPGLILFLDEVLSLQGFIQTSSSKVCGL